MGRARNIIRLAIIPTGLPTDSPSHAHDGFQFTAGERLRKDPLSPFLVAGIVIADIAQEPQERSRRVHCIVGIAGVNHPVVQINDLSEHLDPSGRATSTSFTGPQHAQQGPLAQRVEPAVIAVVHK